MSVRGVNNPEHRSRDDMALEMVARHRDAFPGITAAYRIMAPGNREQDQDEPIKLLEVNCSGTASGMMPVWLPSSPESGLLYPLIIVEIHPSEFVDLQAGRLALPHGWTFDLNRPL